MKSIKMKTKMKRRAKTVKKNPRNVLAKAIAKDKAKILEFKIFNFLSKNLKIIMNSI
jgi:hypothetical protein